MKKLTAAVSIMARSIRRSNAVRSVSRYVRQRMLPHGPVLVALSMLLASLGFVSYSAMYQLSGSQPVVMMSGSYQNELIKQELTQFLTMAAPRRSTVLKTSESTAAKATENTPAIAAEAIAPQPSSRSLVLTDADFDIYQDAVKHLADREPTALDDALAKAHDPILKGTMQALALLRGLYDDAQTVEKAQTWLAAYGNLPQRPLIERLAKGASPASVQYGVDMALAGFTLDSQTHESAPGASKSESALPLGAIAGSPSASASSCQAALNNARDMFRNGEDKALTSTLSGCGRVSGANESFYIAGLSAWRLKEYSKAAHFFSLAYRTPASNAWDKSAAAFWAYRSYARMGSDKHANVYLSAAAEYPSTFYGLLARKALDEGDRAVEPPAQLKPRERLLLLRQEAVRRVVALQELGMSEAARHELTPVLAKAHSRQRRQLFALADQVGLRVFAPDFQTYSKEMVNAKNFGFAPNGGFKVDPALIFALVKKESRFNADAVSPRGAVGLMQLMPETAQYLKRQAKLNGITTEDLKKPGTNLQLGQAYVRYLMDKPEVGQNLFYLLTAYNAGPGNLARWQDSTPGARHDPLLFIESIPSAETRNFVEKVTADYWHYRMAMGAGNPSMKQVLAGKWPEYLPFATQMASLADDHATVVVAK